MGKDLKGKDISQSCRSVVSGVRTQNLMMCMFYESIESVLKIVQQIVQ